MFDRSGDPDGEGSLTRRSFKRRSVQPTCSGRTYLARQSVAIKSGQRPWSLAGRHSRRQGPAAKRVCNKGYRGNVRAAQGRTGGMGRERPRQFSTIPCRTVRPLSTAWGADWRLVLTPSIRHWADGGTRSMKQRESKVDRPPLHVSQFGNEAGRSMTLHDMHPPSGHRVLQLTRTAWAQGNFLGSRTSVSCLIPTGQHVAKSRRGRVVGSVPR